MTVRNLGARIAGVKQIEGIVSALHALALAHEREAQNHVDAIRAHEQAVGSTLAQALRMGPRPAPEGPDQGEGGSLLIVVGTAQGFTGAFGDRLAEVAAPAPGQAVLVIGARTAQTMGAAGHAPVWSDDMPVHPVDVPALASRIADVVFERISSGSTRRVSIVYAEPEGTGPTLRRRSLLPFDFDRFAAVSAHEALTTLPLNVLMTSLVVEYVFAELCEVLMLGFAAESAARAEAMSRAQTNVRRIADELHGQAVRARQQGITAEILELGLRRRSSRS